MTQKTRTNKTLSIILFILIISLLFIPYVSAVVDLKTPIGIADKNGIKQDASFYLIDGESFIIINNMGFIFVKYYSMENESLIYYNDMAYNNLFMLDTHDKAIIEVSDINKTLLKKFIIYTNTFDNLLTYGPISFLNNYSIVVIPGAVLGVLFAVSTHVYKRRRII